VAGVHRAGTASPGSIQTSAKTRK